MSARLFLAAASSVAAASSAAAAPPNFLLLFPDQLRGDWAGSLEGMSALRMPTLEALAAGGTRFRQAFVPAPVCAPSRACLAAGREYDEAGVASNFANDYPINQTTFYTLLKQAGYHTMTTGKDDLTKATGPNINGTFHAAELGFVDFLRVKGKDDVKGASPSDPYGEYLLEHTTTDPASGKNVTLWDVYNSVDNSCCSTVPGASGGYFCEDPTIMPTPAYEDNFVAGLALELLDRKPAGVPWFLQISFPGPHPPFIVTEAMINTTKSEDFPAAVDNPQLSRADNEAIRQLYAAELENLDALFARVLAKVDALGERDNTVVIVASDHGEMLGDHSDWGKTMPWQGSASVPLIVSAPALGVKAATVVQGTPFATMDIAGTVLELAGTAPVAGMTTTSFANVLKGAPGSAYARPFVSSGLANWRAVVKTEGPAMYKYICCKGACPGQPSNATGAGEVARGFVDEEWSLRARRAADDAAGGAAAATAASLTRLLYDVAADPYDTNNILAAHPSVGAELEKLLPAGFCV
jgi:hypothetical protein